jgi:hypothetical protein
MRWFKHWSDASSDLFIQEFCERFGDAGYCFWFRTLELLARQGREGSLDISEATWRQVVHSGRTDHLRRLYAFATERGKLQVEILSNGLLRVKCLKFAEIADEYSRKLRTNSGQSPKSSTSTSTSLLSLESGSKKKETTGLGLRQRTAVEFREGTLLGDIRRQHNEELRQKGNGSEAEKVF